MNRTIEISTGTILRTIFIVLLLWFLYLVRGIVFLVFLSVVIVSAINPIVNLLKKRKVPRSLSVIVIYILSISIFAAAIYFLVPPLISEISEMGKGIPQVVDMLSKYSKGFQNFAAEHNFQQNATSLTPNIAEKLSQVGVGFFSGAVLFVGGIVEFTIVLCIAFYMTVEEEGIKKAVVSLVPGEHREYVASLVERIQFKMGRWLHGQMMLMFMIFALDYVGLLIIKAPYALLLALLAGILEIIPFIGPVISAIIAAAVCFLHGPLTGILALILFLGVQQLESYVFTPLVMKRAVSLSPVVVILALMIGAKLGGLIGAVVAIPVTAMVGEVINDLNRAPKERKQDS